MGVTVVVVLDGTVMACRNGLYRKGYLRVMLSKTFMLKLCLLNGAYCV